MPNNCREPSQSRWFIKQATRFCLSAHMTMFEILAILCIRFKLYIWIWSIKLWQNYAMTRKHSAEKILKQSAVQVIIFICICEVLKQQKILFYLHSSEIQLIKRLSCKYKIVCFHSNPLYQDSERTNNIQYSSWRH